jgi:hypothetical protein
MGKFLSLRRLAGIFILLVGQMLHSENAWADSWQQSFSSKISTGYDTNPAMASPSPGGAWIGLFDPGYTLTGRVGDNEIKTGLDLLLATSSNKNLSPNRENPTGFLNWLRKNDAGEFGISTKYSQVATRDAGIDATGQVPATSTRASRALAGNWSRDLSEYSTLSADGSYEGVSYSGGGAFANYSSQSAGLKFSHALTDQITSFLRMSDTEFILTNGGQSTQRVDTLLGVDWKVEFIDWTIQAGQSRAGGGNSDKIGSIAAHYTGLRSQLVLNASRMVLPSGLGAFVKSAEYGGNWNYALSDYSTIGMDFDHINNILTTDNSVSSATTTGVWIDRGLTSLWKVRTYLLHRVFQITQTSIPASAASNMIGVSFTYDNSNF